MTVNASFEVEGVRKGTAFFWGFAESTQFVDVAEFGPLCGYERFEIEWRMALGRNIQNGSTVIPFFWATLVDGTTPFIAAPPASEYVHSPALILVAGSLAADVTISVQYTNQAGVPLRSASVVIPAGEDGTHEYVLVLEATDKGFKSIQSITAPGALPGTTIAVVGSWLKSPLNEAFKLAFALADLFIGQFTGNDFDAFEAGWGNDPGKLDNFDAIESETAAFDTVPQPVEDFENEWRMPQPFGPFANEDIRFSHDPFVDSLISDIAYGVFEIFAGANDRIRLSWSDGGTFADLDVQIAAGVYGSRTAHIQAVDGSSFVDGETFTIDDGVNPLVTFEFDSGGGVGVGNVAVPFAVTDDASIVRDSMITAINAAALDVTAQSFGAGVLHIDHDELGRFPILTEAVAAAGFVLTPALAQELQTKIKAALDVDTGDTDGVDFRVLVVTGGQLRLETLYDGPSGRPTMELLTGNDSAWTTLGFVPGQATQRATELRNLVTALFDVGVESSENYENGWRDNENSITAFTGGDLEAASFDVGTPEAFEDFEEEWILTL